MAILREIFIGLISNAIWVVMVFVILFIWERKKKEQMARCLGAYLIFLLKSTALVRNTVYPYVYLIKIKSCEGTILSTLLEDIHRMISNLLEQTQEALQFTQSQKMEEQILKLYHQTILFQARISESKVQANIIVGNPTKLVEPPLQEQEIKAFEDFLKDFHQGVRELYQMASPPLQKGVPEEIYQLLDQKSPLEEG